MSKHRVQIELVVDDEALAEHVTATEGSAPPYSEDISDWNVEDIARAADAEIVDLGDCAFDYMEKIPEETA